MQQQPSSGEVSILHETDLGRHTLFIMSNQSIDLHAHEETPYIADNVMNLDHEETYRLLVSLQTLFQQEGW
jgi:hypothetical protein